ncbi:PKD domain-containing protein [Lacibacter sediminis]|uniref:PKD domain-containing protein n=1 Tax=Lacibacter sediminis TaxID=2760713 RepID=A0A7G5XG52_9BACT|nr:PKD domain-containing protein [Lacibacter sediminis]QNA44455.1 PKD domain-containing protein [Lacibacter sediminis]
MKKVIYSFIALLVVFTSKAQDNPCKGKAAFQLTISGNTVKFYSATTVNTPVVHSWKFGDGQTADGANPTHTYIASGNYRVVHYIKDTVLKCYDSAVKEFSIPQSLCDLVQAKFEWKKDSSNAFKVIFINQSLLNSAATSVSYKWIFGDGTFSTDANPAHAYTKPGVYKVCLVVTVSNTCVREICKEVRIGECNFDAGFSWVLDNAHPMRGVKFNPFPSPIASTPLSVKWSFGDGTYSTEFSPLHQYQQPGTYKVCLRIEYFAGCVKEVCKEVTVPPLENCEALSRFTMERISSSPHTLYFKAEANSSVIKYIWTFGDGTGALGATATHKYDRPGTYRICLTIYRSDNCASTTCKEVVIGDLNCEQTTMKFEMQRMNPPHNNAVKFTAVSNQPITSQSWTIWRSNSTTPVKINVNDPTYIFQDTGYYKVCLRATTANGCVKEYCNYVHITYVPRECHLQITPNPAIANIQFKVQVEIAKPVVASIIDMTGMRKAVFYLNAVPGVNTFTLPVTTLAPGYYTLEVKVGDQVCTSKFQKVN